MIRFFWLAVSVAGVESFQSSHHGLDAVSVRDTTVRRASIASHDIKPVYDLPDAWAAEGRSTNLESIEQYNAMYKKSIEDPAAFWAEIASGFEWRGAPLDAAKGLQYNFDRTKGKVFIEWFKGSTTNLAFNCLDRQVAAGLGDQVALYAERNGVGESAAYQPDSYTYSELLSEVNKLAQALRAKGVKKGDRVAVFMAHVPENCVAMLACARLGAVHSVVFGGFSKEALASRIVDCGARVVIAQDGVMRGGKLVALKGIVDAALPLVEEMGGEPVEATIVLKRLGTPDCAATMEMVEGRDVWWHEALAAEDPSECETEWVDAEDPAFILYTSGSTGKPKGILHTTGGYMVGTATTFKYTFDFQPESDVFFCTADCGWITGHSYVTYGPLLNGATQVVFEGVPSYPTASRLWEVVDKYAVTHLYTAPTLIRGLMAHGEDLVSSTSRKSLKLLGTVGEPINPEAWRWYFEVVGDSRCPIVDTWWQTETGAHMISPMPTKGWGLKPGSASLPSFGVQPALLDPQGKELPESDGPAEGLLAVKAPWPSALRGVWGDPKRFEETYFPFKGYYLTGDGARRDEDGYYWITGRVDDVVIVSGHNIGTAEVESAVVLHPKVAEAAAVGVDHPVKGQAMYVFVTLTDDFEGDPNDPELSKELKGLVRSKVGAFAAPDTFHYTPTGLPKTRSGKIMRRVLRKVASLGKAVTPADLGDTSTLADPSVVDDLVASHASNGK
mmetsp:Transcript_20100/g.45501  ORF Transcript_20100/g.45501 Transcript_20100/m.45501 type:complete len:728 (-) Transcript_20100:312-2495(-)